MRPRGSRSSRLSGFRASRDFGVPEEDVPSLAEEGRSTSGIAGQPARPVTAADTGTAPSLDLVSAD